jgi:hypothetical protein
MEKKEKCHFFPKTEQEGKTGPVRGVGTYGGDTRKESRRVNMMEILCIHVGKWKRGAY